MNHYYAIIDFVRTDAVLGNQFERAATTDSFLTIGIELLANDIYAANGIVHAFIKGALLFAPVESDIRCREITSSKTRGQQYRTIETAGLLSPEIKEFFHVMA